ncbi:MAG: mechanosensitive ion channel family protein [Mariprofundus sp.]
MIVIKMMAFVALLFFGQGFCLSEPVALDGNHEIQISPRMDAQTDGGIKAPKEAIVAFYDDSVFKGATIDQRTLSKIKELAVIGQKLRVSDSQSIDRLMKQSDEKVHELFLYILGKSEIGEGRDIANQIRTLESRASINKAHGNKIAVQRDMVKIKFLEIYKEAERYVTRLWAISHGYQKKGDIAGETRQAIESIAHMENNILSTPVEKAVVGNVTRDLHHNLHDLYSMVYIYKNILNYAADNSKLIIEHSWTRYLSLATWIDYFNSHAISREINLRLNIFNLDTGGIAVSLMLFFLVVMLYPVLFRMSRFYIGRYIVREAKNDATASSLKEFAYLELRKPVRALLVFFGLHMSAGALLYRTEFLAAADALAFVVYAMLFFWLFLGALNTVVAIKIATLNQQNIGMRKELFNLIVHIIKIVVFAMVIIIISMHFGISIAAILSTLGIGGLAFALAAKDTLANFFGGIAILMDNVFRLGDLVRIKDSEGVIAEIGLRSTTIRTFENALITIPNSQVSTMDVMNWSKRKVGRRIKISIRLTYESDMEDVKHVVSDIREMLHQHAGIVNPGDHVFTANERAVQFYNQEDIHGIKNNQLVFFERLNDYSIDIMVYCFSKTVNWEEWLKVKEDVLYRITDIMKKNHVEFAYPTEVRIEKSLVE